MRILESHTVQLRGRRRLWAWIRGRPTRYRVIDRLGLEPAAEAAEAALALKTSSSAERSHHGGGRMGRPRNERSDHAPTAQDPE